MLVVEMTGRMILATLEEGLETSATGEPGAHPCGAGVRFSVDFDASIGNRLNDVEIKHLDQWSPINWNEIYLVATNEFLMLGGNGYTTFTYIEDRQST
jgi:2',3'-cyclic-nucleotide 2'-phosphodiesterase (5'-nucleotidase family)